MTHVTATAIVLAAVLLTVTSGTSPDYMAMGKYGVQLGPYRSIALSLFPIALSLFPIALSLFRSIALSLFRSIALSLGTFALYVVHLGTSVLC